MNIKMKTTTENTNKIKEDSLVKRILFAGGETANAMKLSYVSGLALGTVGRLTNQDYLPAILPLIDLIHGATPTRDRLACYMAYGAGIATAYTDKIYPSVIEIADKI